VYLKHILDAISDVKRFVKDVTKEEFLANKEKQYAVLRALEIIGEATKNLSKEMRREHSEVQWSDIAGMRDKLIHEYFGVKLELVWATVKNNLPEFEKQIRQILQETANDC